MVTYCNCMRIPLSVGVPLLLTTQIPPIEEQSQQKNFYLVHSCYALWDSLSRFMPSGIACLAFHTPDWAVAFWDGLSGL